MPSTRSSNGAAWRVVCLNPMLHPAGPDLLRENGVEVDVVAATDHHSVEDALAEAHGVVVRLPADFPADRVHLAVRARVISSSGAGVDHIDVATATRVGLPVVNNPGVGARAVAEHAVALMLALAKRIPIADRLIRADGWACREAFHGDAMAGDLSGRTLGLVGFGAIAREVAQICSSGFGMRVEVFARHRPDGLTYSWCPELAELARRSDYLSIHLPLTDETSGIVSRDVIAALRPHAYLINTARGRVVDNEALREALVAGRLAGAGLDVFPTEPLAVAEPLLALANVVATPHVAGISEDACRNLARSAAAQVIQVLSGERPPHLVNPGVWATRRIASRSDDTRAVQGRNR